MDSSTWSFIHPLRGPSVLGGNGGGELGLKPCLIHLCITKCLALTILHSFIHSFIHSINCVFHVWARK